MPESVTATAGSTVEAPGFDRYAPPAAGPSQTNELGKDEFLQLLVAQLKYQDPLEPQSSDEFIATSAQFTVVEKLEELTAQGENTALINALATASSLIGREVTALGSDGQTLTATVERSELVGTAVELVTAEGRVALERVTSVGEAADDTNDAGSGGTPATNDQP